MTNRTGYEKMRSGEAYAAPDWDLIAMQVEARARLDDYNAIRDIDERRQRLPTLLGSAGRAIVMSPVFWEYGKHIHLGDAVFVNFDCIFLDGADIRIGDGTVVAPRVQFLTAGHPVEPHERVTRDPVTGQRSGGMTINKPITIGRDCWIGANALIMGGVTIGDGTTIGAGSVVTRDIPANVVAAGSPARIIRHLKGATAANAA